LNSRLYIKESDEYSLVLDWNYNDLDETIKNYKKDNNEKIFYMAIQDNEDDLCIGLTLEGMQKLQNHIDEMIKYIIN